VVYAQRQRKVAAARLPGAWVIHRPKHPVHGVNRGLSHAGTGVDGDQAARRAAIKHVARMQVPMQQHRHASIGNKPSRELVAPSESLDWNGGESPSRRAGRTASDTTPFATTGAPLRCSPPMRIATSSSSTAMPSSDSGISLGMASSNSAPNATS